MPYDIPRPSGYRIQPFKLQDDEALVAAMAQQLLKARLAQARAASGGGGGGGGRGGKSGGKGKGEWVMKYNPETKRYDKVWIEGKTKEEREINAKGEDFNKTADWLDSNPEAQRLLGVLRNGKASNAAKQKALAEFRSLKGAEALEGMKPEAVEEVIERQAKPYKEQVEAEKKEIAGAGSGLMTNLQVGLERLGTFFDTIGDDASTTLEKRRRSLERQQAIREADPYTREQMRREAEGESLWERSNGASGVAANVAGALLSDPSALPIAAGALAGAAIGGPVGAGIGASLAGAGGAAAGDTYLGERLAQDDRLSEAERARAYEEGKASEMGINAAVNAIPFGGAQAWRMGRTAMAAAGRGALGRQAAAAAENFAANPAWRTAEATSDYARRFAFAPNAEEQVAKAAMRPIAADLVQQSERTVGGTIKHVALPEAAMASGLNAGAMMEGNIHYNRLTGQNDPVSEGVPEAAAMGLMFGIPATVGGGLRAFRARPGWTSPEGRLSADQTARPSAGSGTPAPADGGTPPAASGARTGGTPPEGGSGGAAQAMPAPSELPSTASGFAELFPKNATPDEIRSVLDGNGWTSSGVRKYMMGKFPEAVSSNAHGLGDIYAKMGDFIEQARPAPGVAATSDVPLRTGREFVPTRAETPEGASPFPRFDETLTDSMGMNPYTDYSRSDPGRPYVETPRGETFIPTRPAEAPEGAAPFSSPDGVLTNDMGMRPYRDYSGREAGTPYRERQNAAFTPTRPAEAPEGAAPFAGPDGTLTDDMGMRPYTNYIRPESGTPYRGAPETPPPPTAAAQYPRQNLSPLNQTPTDRFIMRPGEDTFMLAGGRPDGQRRISEAGQSAAVSGAGRQGEAGARQADTGTGRPLGTDTQNPAGANASGVSPQTGTGDTPHQGSRTGGRPGGSPAPAQNPAGGAGAERTGRKPRGKGSVGKRGAGNAAESGSDANTVAGGSRNPAEPSAGSDSAGGSPAPQVAPVSAAESPAPQAAPGKRGSRSGNPAPVPHPLAALSKKEAGEVKNILGTVGAPDLEVEGVAAKAKLLEKRGLGRDTVAALADRVAARDGDFFTQRRSGPVINAAGIGVLRLADHYGVPVVKPETIASAPAGARPVLERLNAAAAGTVPIGRQANWTHALRMSSYNTPEWRKAAASVLNFDMLETKRQMAKNRGVLDEAGTAAKDFYAQNFDGNWKTSGNPIDGADIHYAIDPEGATREAATANAEGTPYC